MNILLVEDEQGVLKLYAKILEEKGHKAVTASRGE